MFQSITPKGVTLSKEVQMNPQMQQQDPQMLLQMGFSFMPARIMMTAVQLNVFTHIAEGRKSANAIAEAENASSRGLRMLLDSLTALQLLTKSDDGYELTPLAAQCLVKTSEDYIGGIWETDNMWDAWGGLTEIVRKGKPRHAVENQQVAEMFFPMLVKSLHVINREPARRTAETLGAGTRHKGLSVLDVACGSGIWGIAIAERDKEARLTMQDFPVVLEDTKKYLERHGVLDRADFIAGDLKEVAFGEERFDVALLGNIVHSEGEESSRDLFKRINRALKPNGRIVVIDMIPNDERTAPPFPLFFALNMFINTSVGDCYTLAEYTAWLNEAGFSKIETADIASHSPLIIGVKE
jgi:ubiquinone/menaquinone biosynthesis C-methylase UbiE